MHWRSSCFDVNCFTHRNVVAPRTKTRVHIDLGAVLLARTPIDRPPWLYKATDILMIDQLRFEGQQVRVILDNSGNPTWVAKDVCEALGLDDTSRAVERLDDDEKGTSIVRTLGGDQEMLVINESGLYSLILRSRKPEAKRFKKWVTAEVLPMIRKHGVYAPEEQYSMMRAAMQLMTGFATEVQVLQSRLEKLEESASEANMLTADLPEPFSVLPGFTNANSINKAVRAYAKFTGYGIGAVMSMVYSEIEFRYKLRIGARKKRAGYQGSTLQFAIEQGWGEIVYTVIHAMIQRAMQQRAA